MEPKKPMPKGGRRWKPEELRPIVSRIGSQEAERKNWEWQAKKAGLSLSEWARVTLNKQAHAHGIARTLKNKKYGGVTLPAKMIMELVELVLGDEL